MKYTIIIPSAGGDRLYQCLDSISPDIHENIIIYKNAPLIDTSAYTVRTAGTGVNDGLARAWNYGRNDVIENNKDYLIIVSQNTTFKKGMTDFLRSLEEESPEYGAWSTVQWHCTAFSRKTLELAGEFDTNIYPIYYEDTEYATRLHVLGILDTIRVIDVDANWDSGYSTTLGMRPDVEPLRLYVARKWGQVLNWSGYKTQEFYKYPFNNPSNSIDFFEKHTIDELKKLYGYDLREHDLYIESVREAL